MWSPMWSPSMWSQRLGLLGSERTEAEEIRPAVGYNRGQKPHWRGSGYRWNSLEFSGNGVYTSYKHQEGVVQVTLGTMKRAI